MSLGEPPIILKKALMLSGSSSLLIGSAIVTRLGVDENGQRVECQIESCDGAEEVRN